MEAYKDEEWLRGEYKEKRRNATDIADDFDVHHQNIYYYLDKFSIEKRTRGFRGGEEHPNYSGAKEEYECPVCSDVFERRPSDVQNNENGPFCSLDCLAEHRSEIMKGNDISMTGEDHPLYDSPEDNPMYGVRGEDHPNWQGGYDQDFRETPEWYHARREALERDDHECAECGMGRENHREEHDRDLEVHHITPVSVGGAKFDLDNLTSLCVPCHNEAHRRLRGVVS